MNFLTARLYALAGVPIARSSWGDQYDNGPQRWITYESGAWFNNTPAEKEVLLSGDSPTLLAGDYMARDWMLAQEPSFIVACQPDFPVTPFVHNIPVIDVYSPSEP